MNMVQYIVLLPIRSITSSRDEPHEDIYDCFLALYIDSFFYSLQILSLLMLADILTKYI